MALTGVPIMAEELAAEGKVSVFSMISKLVIPRPVPMDADVVGKTKVTRNRRGFTTFSCQAYIGDELLDSEVLSGAAALSDVAAAPVRPFTAAHDGEAIAKIAGKPDAMTFVDVVEKLDDNTITCAYSYPEDHPCVPGHFPRCGADDGRHAVERDCGCCLGSQKAFGYQWPRCG